MSKGAAKNQHQRRIIYLVSGIIIGITVMILPFLVHNMMGPTSPFMSGLTDPQVFSTQVISPIDAAIEFFWLALPAIFIILILYWIAGRRTRWKGYDDAVKWSRR